MFCSVIFSSLLLIQREGVSASYLTPNTEIQFSPKPLNIMNNSSSDYTEMPRRKRRTFGNQGIIKRRNGAKRRRHQNRGRLWNKRCDGRRGRRRNVESDSKFESKCGKFLADLNETKRGGGRGTRQTAKKIEMFKTCVDKIVRKAERYNINMTIYNVLNTEQKLNFVSTNKKWMDIFLTLVCWCSNHIQGSVDRVFLAVLLHFHCAFSLYSVVLMQIIVSWNIEFCLREVLKNYIKMAWFDSTWSSAIMKRQASQQQVTVSSRKAWRQPD